MYATPNPRREKKNGHQRFTFFLSCFVGIRRSTVYYRYFEEKKNGTSQPWTSELLVSGATTTMSTAEPLRSPISRAGVTVSLVACLRDTA